ncbi:viral Gp157 protein [Kushneria sinocarnis]|uniref:Viral Gp157 protein n=2 Tax=Kushneria sinocarnis TaxID=595502 RepID=A0A420WUI3_9GAMM|nr:viral Gp157 protein [Kushneria sinocarnis]
MDAADDEAFREALDETLTAQGEMLDEKIEATIIVARQLDEDAEYCKAEIDRLRKRAESFRRNADACRERVRMAMESTGRDKIKRRLFTISRVAGKDVARLDDEQQLPADYVRVKETRSPDKAAILKALKAGQSVPGASLGKGQDSLRIS